MRQSGRGKRAIEGQFEGLGAPRLGSSPSSAARVSCLSSSDLVARGTEPSVSAA